MYDIIIRNGTVIDGTRAPRFKADIGLVGDRITGVGDLAAQEAGHTIDAAGKIVAPGFVDTHNHSDAWLLKTPHLLPKTKQGFTSEVIMADGISYAPVDDNTRHEWIFYLRALNALLYQEDKGWESLADYMGHIEGHNVQNAATHIPYANLRAMACGWGRKVPDDFEMGQIIADVEKGMDQGAVGLSTGIDYISECFATTDELVEACRPMAAKQGLYVTHVRYKKGTLEGVQEAVEIGRRAHVPVHISHFKATTPQQTEELLAYVDNVASQEVDFSFDVYPYLPGSTMLNFLLPYAIWEEGPIAAMTHLKDPAMRRQFAQYLQNTPLDKAFIAWLPSRDNAHYQGQTLADYIAQVGKPAADALCDLLIEEHLAVLLVFHHGDDAGVFDYLKHDKFMIGTDGIYFPDGAVHPRMYGSAGRILGPCVRDHRLFSLEDAVYKMAGYPASRFGLTDRGTIAAGKFADLVVFDAETVVDRATYQDPHQYTEGIEHVLVNGTPIIAAGDPVDDLPNPLPGRYLRFKG
ncbi:MAG: amidohydrolase family protein [Candidatus Latescibacteria bacterium]|nr:amidohydrolase family protein [Candidatus Latescibacterota bacterium]